MNTNPAASLWKHRWGPAYQWESLVCCKDFRRNATVQFYDVYSNTKLYQDEPPGGLNYCARCASGQRYECLFFHPTISEIFLDIIKALGKTKLGSIDDMTNLEFLDRVFRVLPAHYTQLGFPCQLGGIWRCIVDKLDQTFPLGVLMMLDVASFLQCNNSHIFDVYNCCHGESSSDDSTGSSQDEEDVIVKANLLVQATSTKIVAPVPVVTNPYRAIQKKFVVKKKQGLLKHAGGMHPK